MHQSAYDEMKRCIERYMPNDRPYVVVDFGSRCSPRQTLTHRDLLRQDKCHIIGLDVKPGRYVSDVPSRGHVHDVYRLLALLSRRHSRIGRPSAALP